MSGGNCPRRKSPNLLDRLLNQTTVQTFVPTFQHCGASALSFSMTDSDSELAVTYTDAHVDLYTPSGAYPFRDAELLFTCL